MPDTTIVVGAVVGLVLLVVALFVLRSRSKAEPEQPRFEPPREIAKREKDKEPAAKAEEPPASAKPAEAKTAPLPKIKTPAIAFPAKQPTPLPHLRPVEDADEATRVDASPPSTEEINQDEILSERPQQKDTARPPAASVPPPLPPKSDPKAASAAEPLPSFPLEDRAKPIDTPKPEPKPPVRLPTSEPRVATAKPLPAPPPKVITPAKPLPISEPKIPVAAKLPVSEPKVPVAAKLPVSEPKIPVAAKLPASEPKIPVAAQAAVKSDAEHDFSALNDAPKAKAQAAAATAAATAARFAPPPNPATADLEKNDPRHAAARRLARVSVSEIKLYHEEEVKTGRESNDLWARLQQDIALAKQTFEARVVPEVRDRFDYLLDEIIRQLAEGDPKKLGAGAPTPSQAKADAAPPPPVVEALDQKTAPPPPIVDEAPTKTHKVLPDEEAVAPAAEVAVAPPPPPTPAPVVAKKVEPAPVVPTPAPSEPKAADGKPAGPTGIAARGLPPNPETAELEKNDPRHAAARRLARLSVSEIKLYHEDEVRAGREAKDLWKRMITDISLATQTYDKRVDKEVRERFDYLFDEILRQLAENDLSKLGPEAPKKKSVVDAPAPVVAPPPVAEAPIAEAAPVAAPEPEPAPPPPPPSEPKVVEPPKAVAAPVVEEAKPAPTPAAIPSAAARYLPPSNPLTAELEKSDPRHAAARRLARLSVSEIKLYHEDEVKAGREAKDLWKRLITDIGLATQTYEKRVDKEVRERFDYLYDEILRQLAEGDAAKLGVDAPKPKDAN